MSYLYETHAHTCTGFPCGKNTGDELVRYFHSLGYTGLIVTDHILTSEAPEVATRAAWEIRVNRLCLGYEMAKAEGDRIGFDVFQGWEYGDGWNHFLIYGLDRDWLMANPDCLTLDPVEYLRRVRRSGGFVIQAHPFREGVSSYLVIPEQTDGYEVISASRSEDANRHAEDFCRSYGKIRHAGTDIHWLNYPRLAGVDGMRRFTDIHDYIRGLKEGAYTLFDHIQNR